MKTQQGLMSLSSASELIRNGNFLSIAGDEAALRQLPPGNWIGGTIPYFMATEGGTVSRAQVFVTQVTASSHRRNCVFTMPLHCRKSVVMHRKTATAS